MADYIPLKLQAEILKRLPVISLIRFRSVSKQWKSLIDSPKFIADHCVIQHHTQSQHHHHLLLSCLESGLSSWGYVVRYFSIVDDDTFPHQKVFLTTPVSVNPLNYLQLVGVSGGLFCIYGSNRKIMNAVIWNPSIKKTVTIVVPNASYDGYYDGDDDDDDDDDDDVTYHTLVGFGVCPRTSDPNLVKISFNVRHENKNANIPNQVEVFSLSLGLWKPPSSKLPRKSIMYTYNQVIVNEFIYWLVYDMSSLDWEDQLYHHFTHLIISFDLTSEEISEVYLPQSLASNKNGHVLISKLKESLVVLEKNHAANANVWIMQNGDPKSFTHIFTINTPITRIGDVSGFRKNGAPIIAERKGLIEKELIVYEPNSEQINYTGIAGAFISFSVSPYTQTLLLLDHKDSVDSETTIGIGRQVKAKTNPFKTDQEIMDEVFPRTNRGHIAGRGLRLPGTGSSSCRSSQPSQGYCTHEEVAEMMMQHELEKDRLRKQVEENAKALESTQNAFNHFLDFFNRQQAGTSSQYTPPQMYIPQVLPDPSYTPPDLGCCNPTFDLGTS